jgi:integrase
MPFRPKNSRFWHYDFQIGGRRFCGSTYTESFEEAKAVEAQARVAAKTAPDQRGIFTLAEAIGTYWADISQHQTCSGVTLSQGKGLLGILDAKTRLDALTMADIARYVTARRATVANATVNRELQLLGRALRHMAKFHQAKVADLDLRAAEVKEPRERIRELSPEEQARLFKHLRADLHPLVQFALMTGAREATICGLQWHQVDLSNARIRFDMKGGEVMFFPVNGELRAFLSTLPRATLAEHRPYVITYIDQHSDQRKRITPGGGSLKAAFHKATIDAGIADFRFHDLRHSFGTRMLRKTQNLKLVSRLMGHQNIETTMRYAHVMMDDLAGAMEDFTALATAQSRRKSRSKS